VVFLYTYNDGTITGMFTQKQVVDMLTHNTCTLAK